MPEITGREAVERINRALDVLVKSEEVTPAMRAMGWYLLGAKDGGDIEDFIRRAGVPVVAAETEGDILAELAAADRWPIVRRETEGDRWLAYSEDVGGQEGYATPLAALQALRAKLMPPAPVAMTREDVEEIMAGFDAAPTVAKYWLRERLMRHVGEG